LRQRGPKWHVHQIIMAGASVTRPGTADRGRGRVRPGLWGSCQRPASAAGGRRALAGRLALSVPLEVPQAQTAPGAIRH
jgi:hypothetical protein